MLRAGRFLPLFLVGLGCSIPHELDAATQFTLVEGGTDRGERFAALPESEFAKVSTALRDAGVTVGDGDGSLTIWGDAESIGRIREVSASAESAKTMVTELLATGDINVIPTKSRLRVPNWFASPGFAAEFLTNYNVDQVAYRVTRVLITKSKEEVLEPYYSFGYSAGGKQVVNVGMWEDSASAKFDKSKGFAVVEIDPARYLSLPPNVDPTLLLYVHDDNGEALRTETMRIFSELSAKASGVLTIESDQARLESLQLGLVDWLPVINWGWQLGQWVYGQFTQTTEVSKNWQIPLSRSNFYQAPINATVVGVEPIDQAGLPQAWVVANGERDVANYARMRVTYEAKALRCTAHVALDIYYTPRK